MTAAALPDERFQRDPDAPYLILVDRVKDLIIRGGENIYPKEIEEVLHGHPAVLEAADDLLEHCRESLARYKVPREMYLEEVLPKNAVGEVAQPALRGRLRSRPPVPST